MPGPIPPKFYTQDAPFPPEISLRPIGVVRSPHHERHGTPRQAVLPAKPQLRESEETVLELFADVLTPHATNDLEGFEYLWVISWMHLNHGWRNKVAVPGFQKKGLLSTRAPHRPNPIGLSAVRLLRVEDLRIVVERTDLLDGTPILDLKPYVPYCDAFADAKAGWVDERGQTPGN